MLDYKALKGDPTDNIPGIPGVGEKTASKLIATWGTLDALYEHLDEVTPEKLRPLLADHRETVLESRELMRLVRDVDVVLDPERGRVGDYDREAVVRIFREYEFRTLIDRLPPLTGERPEDAVAAMRDLRDAGFPAAQGAGRGAGGGGRAVERRRTAAHRPRPAERRVAPALDGLRHGRRRRRRERGGGRAAAAAAPIAATSPAVEARAEALAAATGDLPGALAAAIVDPGRIELADEARVATLEPWLRRAGRGGRRARASTTRGRWPARRWRSPWPARTAAWSRPRGPRPRSRCGTCWSGSGRRSSATRSSRCSPRGSRRSRTRVPTPVAFDTQIAAYLVNAALRAQKIADVVAERLDLVLPPTAAGLPPTAVAGLEALSVLAVRPSLEQALRDEGAERLFAEIELPLVPILARMEAAGVALDRGRAVRPRARVRDRDRAPRGRDLRRVGHQFTIGIPKQLGEILFVELGLPKGRKTKTGYSTDATVLEELRGRPPGDPARAGLADLHEAALDVRGGAAEPHRARRAAPHAVPPGRGGDRAPVLVRPEPPEHPDPHAARPPDPARVRGGLAGHDAGLRGLQPDRAADHRPRVAATSTSRDAFAREADIHRETAARVLHKAPEDVTGDERSMAKMVNFGLAYGMSDFGLSSRAGISRGGRPGVHHRLLRGVRRDQPLHAPHPRDGGGAGLRGDAAGPPAADPGADARRTARCGPPASGWRSTCRSRARPRTSSRSR